jgi:hypothetical protein
MPNSKLKTEIEGMDAVRQFENEEKEHNDQMTEAEKQMRDEELSFYSNSENDLGDDNIWGLLSGVGGNIYEWYVGLRELKRRMELLLLLYDIKCA